MDRFGETSTFADSLTLISFQAANLRMQFFPAGLLKWEQSFSNSLKSHDKRDRRAFHPPFSFFYLCLSMFVSVQLLYAQPRKRIVPRCTVLASRAVCYERECFFCT